MLTLVINSDVRRQARRGLALAEKWQRAVPQKFVAFGKLLANSQRLNADETQTLKTLQTECADAGGLSEDGGPDVEAVKCLLIGGANYGAKAGQTIRGRLKRGADGRFGSGGSAGQTSALKPEDVGLSASELEAYTALQSGQALSNAQIDALTKAGLAIETEPGKLKLSAAGVRIRNKLARGDVAGAREEAEALKAKKQGKGKAAKGGGGKAAKPTAEEKAAEKRKAMEAALKQLEFTPEDVQAIADFSDTGELEWNSETGKRLVKAGLLTVNKKAEEYVLTTPGRAFLRAIRQGKVVDAKLALKQGRLRMKKKVQGSEAAEVLDEVDMGEYGVWMEVPEDAWVPYGVNSFAALAANKEATQAAEKISLFTYQFRELVRNAMADPNVTDKRAALNDLIDELQTLMDETLGGVQTESAASPTPSPLPSTGKGNELSECELSESASGQVVELAEAETSEPSVRDPLTLVVRMIKPGFGNPKDNHYYPKEVLARDAHVFEGVKGYTTDHRAEERSVRTEVSRVNKIVGFDDAGAPLAEVTVFDPTFAESIRNRRKANALDTLECSIMANGTARKGTVEGKSANVVESITKGLYLDWVTKAGAGGQALEIKESAAPALSPLPPSGTSPVGDRPTGEAGELNKDETPATEAAPEQEATFREEQPAQLETATPAEVAPTPHPPAQAQGESETGKLSDAEVDAVLAKVHPAVAKRLKALTWASEDALREAVQAEVDYLKQVTGSGRPVTLNEAHAQPRRTRAEVDATVEAVSKKYLRG